MTILHIVPRLPPAIDGVGDFATSLGETLGGRFGVENHFLSADPAQPAPASGSVLRERSAGELVRGVEDRRFDFLLLHYSGYGYHKRGVPTWLVEGLEAAHSIPTAVFFHELWVTSQPWKSPFYFAAVQKSLVRRLQKLASVNFTSTPGMKRRLESAGKRAVVVPIPSSISPGCAERPWNRSRLTAMVFGQEHTRERSVRAHSQLLRTLVGSGRLERVKLVGKEAGRGSLDYSAAAALVGSERVQTAANLSAEGIARELKGADFCLSFYPLDFLTKSSTVMAALACGCPVILPVQRGREEFSPKPPVVLCDGSEAAIARDLHRENLRRIGSAGLDWYERFASWDRLMEKMAPALGVTLSTARA
jgi:glycosyltransferase involved in cell wall biosynthesis